MQYFLNEIAVNVYADYAIRLLISALCGFLLGIERKIRMNTVGIRTLVLISISSGLLSILSVFVAENFSASGDPTRIASGVVTGIGFIGGGAIVKMGLNIRGVTTAAVTFSAAAVGLCCGAGLYIPAFITLAIALFTLFLMGKIEKKMFPAGQTKFINIEFSEPEVDENSIKQILHSHGFLITDTNVTFSKIGGLVISYSANTPDTLDTVKFTKDLSELPNFQAFSLEVEGFNN